jgi:hypothetical protein
MRWKGKQLASNVSGVKRSRKLPRSAKFLGQAAVAVHGCNNMFVCDLNAIINCTSFLLLLTAHDWDWEWFGMIGRKVLLGLLEAL